MKEHVVVEWAPFRLVPGVTEEQLVAASRDLQENFLGKQPGFLRRELLRGQSGEWVDLAFWADRAAAERAMTSAAESSACHVYFALMAGADAHDPSNGVLHFARVESYE
jgi:hypothetical protein